MTWMKIQIMQIGILVSLVTPKYSNKIKTFFPIYSWKQKKVYPDEWNTISQWHLSSTGKISYL